MSFNGTVADNCTQDNPGAVRQIVFQISGELREALLAILPLCRESLRSCVWGFPCISEDMGMFVFSTQLHCKWQVSQVYVRNRVKLCRATSNIRSEKRFSKMSVTSSQQLVSPGMASIHPRFPILFLLTLYCVVSPILLSSTYAGLLRSDEYLQRPKCLMEESVGTGSYRSELWRNRYCATACAASDS